jgi:cytochrome c-type protein NapB
MRARLIIVLVLLSAFMLMGCSEHSPTPAQDKAAPVPMGFDSGGNKIFNTYNETPISKMVSDSGDRTLATYYERRQYPGAPPIIPHKIETSFSGKADNCLSCHEKGGHDAQLGKSVPVTPHPEKEACRQCHVPSKNVKLFVGHEWFSIKKPRLGQSFLPGSPPPIPHSIQMRDNCIACHTGEGAVVQLRVEHPSRGNCRQCHVPAIPSEKLKIYKRKS